MKMNISKIWSSRELPHENKIIGDEEVDSDKPILL